MQREYPRRMSCVGHDPRSPICYPARTRSDEGQVHLVEAVVVYRIRIKGHLDSRWSEWFDGLTITNEPTGETLLTGPIPDQAALHGILAKVRDLGLTLVSVTPSDE